MSYENVCIHFNGLMQANCKKGHHYGEVSIGDNLEIPCLNCKKCQAVCPDYQEPSKEKKAQEQAVYDKIKYIEEAVEQIKSITGAEPIWEGCSNENKKSSSGTIVCPKCGKTLSFFVAQGNHHISGKCKTPDCLVWMT